MTAHSMVRSIIDRMSKVAPPATWAPAAAVVLINVLLTLAVGLRTNTTVVLTVVFAIGVAVLGMRLTWRSGWPGPPSRAHERQVDLRGEALPDPPVGGEQYTEDLELTVRVGATPDEDHVEERRSTRPKGILGYRKLTLISPYAYSEAEETSVTPVLTVSDGVTQAVWLPQDDAGRGAVVFTPPASGAPLRWTLSYNTPGGIWNSLRTVGLDFFRYDVRTFPIGRFTVRFIVHPDARTAFVRERNRRGGEIFFERNDQGYLVGQWNGGDPAPRAQYEWDIRVDWSTERENPDHSVSRRITPG